MNSSFEYTARHPLNRSPSKQGFSFGKGDRLPQIKRSCPDVFYEQRSMLDKRTTSFGFGKKVSLAKAGNIPAPDCYKLTGFVNQINKRRISFGKGREELGLLFIGNNNPSPNQYLIKQNKNLRGGFMGRRNQSRFSTQGPGPGQYKNSSVQMGSRHYVLSNFKNPRPVTLKGRVQDLDIVKLQPDKFQSEFVESRTSKYQQSQGRKFGRSEREGPQLRNQRLNPGPGKYHLFSQFGKLVLPFDRIKI